MSPRTRYKRKPRGAAKTARRDVYKMVTDRMLALIERGVSPWRACWKGSANHPRSFASNRRYRGVNVWLLGMTAIEKGYSSPFWLTFKQVVEAGGNVKGQKSTFVVFWKQTRYQVEGDDGEPEDRRGMLLRHYNVFNLDQVARGPEWKAPKHVEEHEGGDDKPAFEPIDAAQLVVDAYVRSIDGQAAPTAAGAEPGDGPVVQHGGSHAFYRLRGDLVQMPPREAFDSPEIYHATLFHELVHSTGAPDRCARKFGDSFGDHAYSEEELVAEFGSAFLCGHTGIDAENVAERSASYLDSWASRLRENVKWAAVAAQRAQRAVDWILGDREWEDEA